MDSQLVVSIDPGQHIGLAVWHPAGILQTKQIIDFNTLDDFLEMTPIEVVVIEDFISDGHTKQGGSSQPASQVIGMVKSASRRRGFELKVQPNTILKITALHSGIQIPAKGHISDDVAAVLHGFYYFESIGMRARDIQL